MELSHQIIVVMNDVKRHIYIYTYARTHIKMVPRGDESLLKQVPSKPINHDLSKTLTILFVRLSFQHKIIVCNFV